MPANRWLDALHYGLLPAALAANLVLVICRLVASLLPVFSWPLQVLLWFAVYAFALECMAASGRGRYEGGHRLRRGVLGRPAADGGQGRSGGPPLGAFEGPREGRRGARSQACTERSRRRCS